MYAIIYKQLLFYKQLMNNCSFLYQIQNNGFFVSLFLKIGTVGNFSYEIIDNN